MSQMGLGSLLNQRCGGAENLKDVREWIKDINDADGVDGGAAMRNPTATTTEGQLAAVSPVENTSCAISENSKPEDGLGLEKNWVGLLMEYRAAHPASTRVIFNEVSVGMRFICTVVISESQTPLGDGTVSFARKKDAKQQAAKKTIEWLIANNHMPADGSVSFPNPVVILPPATGAKTKDSPSCSQQVAELCLRLALNLPTYRLEPQEACPSMWNGYAHFNGDPRMPARVGEFSNVFGRKNAKEECAKDVLELLHGIAAERTEKVRQHEENKKRKRLGKLSDEDINIGNAVRTRFHEP